MQFFGKVVELPLLCNDRVPGLDSAVPWKYRCYSSSTVVDIHAVVVQTALVELPQLQFIDSRRHSNCGAEARLELQTARKP